jgi:hypothetical protein
MDMKTDHTWIVCSICVVLCFDLCNAVFLKHENGKCLGEKTAATCFELLVIGLLKEILRKALVGMRTKLFKRQIFRGRLFSKFEMKMLGANL